VYRSEDLAPLIAPDTGEPGAVRAGQGVVLAWDPITAHNVIRYRGTDLHDLPIVASNSEVSQIRPGDVVMLHLIGAAGASTAYVVGRVTRPGTPAAGSFMELFGLQTASVDTTESTSSSAYTDLTTPGPSVVVRIGKSGRAMVWLSASVGVGGNQHPAGFMSFEASGPTPVAATDRTALSVFSAIISGTSTTAPVTVQASRAVQVSDLAPGTYTFTAKYAAFNIGTLGVTFEFRNITVLPL
jgi:hypothetical protein